MADAGPAPCAPIRAAARACARDRRHLPIPPDGRQESAGTNG
jgi:hypothetical protein